MPYSDDFEPERSHEKFSCSRVGRILGREVTWINAIESDRYAPTLRLLFKIAAVLGTTVDDFFKA